MKLQAAISRSDLMKTIRSFFSDRGVIEVETPLLSRASGLDPYIDVFETLNFVDGWGHEALKKQALYLNTSPEFHMKRLLSEGFPDCFQIAKAFRNGETGPRHQWEFSILEWYRLGFNGEELRKEVEDLLVLVGFSLKATSISWRELYRKYCGFDPVRVSLDTLVDFVSSKELPPLTLSSSSSDLSVDNPVDIDSYLDYILVSFIEPKLGFEGPLWVIDYPGNQAALARTWVDEDGLVWAHRFELYIEGVELANGYWELTDAGDQRARFEADQKMRASLGKRTLNQDEEFLLALEKGLPQCSGIALGLDRLLMLKMGVSNIQDVLLFHNENC